MAMRHDPFSHRIFWSRVVAVLLLGYILATEPPRYFSRQVIDLCESLGLVFLAVAAFGRLWCLVFIAGRKNDELVMDGPYSTVRNPLYVFSFIGAVGFGLAVENPFLALLLAVLFAGYYSVIVRREEAFLEGAFGDAFRQYAARTPRWIPRRSLYHERETVPVIARKMRSGILDAMWFIWAFLLWEILENIRSIT
jgi:protein-S-isoprenylcysteine O-methyltransferase Ste14